MRLQLAEQLRVVDGQVEQKTQVFQDLIDYLRRRGEIEGEYARSLDKLYDRFSSRTRKWEYEKKKKSPLMLEKLFLTCEESVYTVKKKK